MYPCINGWTKKKMLNVLKKRRYNVPAVDKESETCVYLTGNGNKCAVGMFIPSGHEAQHLEGTVRALFDAYPDLFYKMPLNFEGMGMLQFIHDSTYENGKLGNAKRAMIDWVEANVKAEK